MAHTMLASAAHQRVDLRLPVALVAVYLIWGSTYLAMAIAMRELPPFLVGSMRFAAAGGVMLLVAVGRGAAWPTRSDWRRAAPVGLFMFVGGSGFVALALKSHAATSGGAAVVAAMMPLWVGVLGALGGAKPSPREWGSLLLGFLGVVVLLGGPALANDPLHVGLLLASPLSWAIGVVVARRQPRSPEPFMSPALQMIIGGSAFAVLGLLLGERIPSQVSAASWLAVAYLWLAGSIIAFTAFSWLVRSARPAVATSYAYVNPIVAVVLGAASSGEPLGLTTIVASGLIVAAVVLALSSAASRR